MSISYQRIAAATFALLLVGAQCARAEVFVTNDPGNTIQVFSRAATGSATPLRNITGLNQPRGIYVDETRGEVYVALVGDAVSVFSISATGAAAPIRTFTQNNNNSNALGDFQGIHVANDEIFIANRNGSVTVFPRLTNGSNQSPTRTIVGASTGLAQSRGVFVSGDELYVAANSPASIRVFSRTASGDVPALRVITNTTAPSLGETSQLLVANNEVTVADFGTNSIKTWPTSANGNTVSARMISGNAPLLVSPRGVAVCSDTNTLVVANRNGNSLNFFPITASGDVAPSAVITGLNGPRFVACTSDVPTIAASIPTLAGWGFSSLFLLLGVGALFALRRRNTH